MFIQVWTSHEVTVAKINTSQEHWLSSLENDSAWQCTMLLTMSSPIARLVESPETSTPRCLQLIGCSAASDFTPSWSACHLLEWELHSWITTTLKNLFLKHEIGESSLSTLRELMCVWGLLLHALNLSSSPWTLKQHRLMETTSICYHECVITSSCVTTG